MSKTRPTRDELLEERKAILQEYIEDLRGTEGKLTRELNSVRLAILTKAARLQQYEEEDEQS